MVDDVSHEPHRPSWYRPDVDGLRAVAILSVLFFHAFPSWVPGGFVGVDVFFVISGYLITGIIVRGLDSGTFTFETFYGRRIRRIFPALTVVLIATYMVGWQVLLPSEFSQLGKHIAAGIGFVQNIVLWSEAGYFDTESASKPLLHLWSLGVEEQFYLIFPLVLWIAFRSKKVSSLAVVSGLTVVCFALDVAHIKQDPTAVYFLPYYRFWELTIGGIVAHARGIGALRPFRNTLSGVGLGLIVAAAFAFSSATPFPGWLALLPVCGTALVILTGPDAWTNKNLLAQKAAVGIGLISYPLYLWHWPVFTFLRIVDPAPPSRSLRIAGVAVSVALAWVTYRAIERPLSKGGRPSLKVAGLAMAGVVLGFVGWGTYQQNGLPVRFPPGVRALVTYKFDPASSYRMGTCYRTSQAGPVFHPEDFSPHCGEHQLGERSMLVWGDSFGASMYAGVKAAFPDVSILQFTQSSCPPIFDLAEGTSRDCPMMNAFVYSTLKTHPADKVLLVANWQPHDWKRVAHTIAAVQAIGILDVVVVGPLPRWAGRLPELMARRALKDNMTAPPVRLVDETLDAQLRFDDELRAFALQNGADYVSPMRLLCDPRSGCLVREHNGPEPLTPLAFDVAHLTNVGTDLLGRLMRDHPTARGKPL